MNEARPARHMAMTLPTSDRTQPFCLRHDPLEVDFDDLAEKLFAQRASVRCGRCECKSLFHGHEHDLHSAEGGQTWSDRSKSEKMEVADHKHVDEHGRRLNLQIGTYLTAGSGSARIEPNKRKQTKGPELLPRLPRRPRSYVHNHSYICILEPLAYGSTSCRYRHMLQNAHIAYCDICIS